MKRRDFSLAALTTLTAAQFPLISIANAQQLGAVKMMIPANPGGGWDQTGRALATAMQSAKTVQSVQFENKGGAAGTIGLVAIRQQRERRSERANRGRHGDGRRHRTEQVAGRS